MVDAYAHLPRKTVTEQYPLWQPAWCNEPARFSVYDRWWISMLENRKILELLSFHIYLSQFSSTEEGFAPKETFSHIYRFSCPTCMCAIAFHGWHPWRLLNIAHVYYIACYKEFCDFSDLNINSNRHFILNQEIIHESLCLGHFHFKLLMITSNTK